jgi:hypothetical protein
MDTNQHISPNSHTQLLFRQAQQHNRDTAHLKACVAGAAVLLRQQAVVRHELPERHLQRNLNLQGRSPSAQMFRNIAQRFTHGATHKPADAYATLWCNCAAQFRTEKRRL